MINQYTGKLYSFRDYNCYHHASLVRKDNGIKTSVFSPRNMGEAFKLIKAEMMSLGNGLTKVDTPQDFDIIFVSRVNNGDEVFHCGVYFDGYVSHCCRLFGSVRVETLGEFKKDYEVVTIWR